MHNKTESVLQFVHAQLFRKVGLIVLFHPPDKQTNLQTERGQSKGEIQTLTLLVFPAFTGKNNIAFIL